MLEKAISFVGFKNSGKTTLILEVAKVLQEKGLKVAIAKFSHNNFDLANTDTGKFLAANCPTLGLSPQTTFLGWPQKKFLLDLLPLIQADVLLVEGGKDLTWLPRIILPLEDQDLEQLDNGLALGYFSQQKFATSLPWLTSAQQVANIAAEKSFILPGLNCGSCGRSNCLEAGQAIVANQADLSICPIRRQDQLVLKVNGQKIGLNPFVERIIYKTLTGILSELKGVSGGEVSLTLKL